MTINVGEFRVKDQIEIRDDILRVLENGLIARGVAAPEVGPKSDAWVWATAIANEIAVVSSNTQIAADAQMPDTATGADLDRLGNMYGITRRPSSKASGSVVFVTSLSVLVAVGTQLIDQSGLRYQVTVGGTYTNTFPNNIIPIESVDAGKEVNHAAGDVLRWVTPPPYADATVTVNTGDLEGGEDLEDDETYRTRILARLASPSGAGNWQQIADIAEASSTSVQKAFIYPAINGPSTMYVVVVGYAQVAGTLTATSKNRDVSSTLISSTVSPGIGNLLPEYVENTVQTPTNVPHDFSVGLSLLAAGSSSPPGPGGGWIDAAPWPRNANSSSTFTCTVTGVTSTTVITVDAPSAPTTGVSRIAFLDPTNWTLQKAKVLSYTGTAGAYVITLDTPFPNIATGHYIWPDCTNAQTYVDTVLQFFYLMGPGEKTSNTASLVRGYRHPIPSNSWPSSLSAKLLKELVSVGNEVLDSQYYYRAYNGDPPSVPTLITDSPGIYTPRNFGFYPLV